MSSTPTYDASKGGAAQKQGGVGREMFLEALMLFNRGFGAVCTALLLALLVTIPIVQFFALGYVLQAAGRYAKTGKFSQAFTGVREASRIGQIVFGVWLITLPLRLLVSLRADAVLIAPGSQQVKTLTTLMWVLGAACAWVFAAALSQGGSFVHFVRPLRATRLFIKRLRKGGFFGESWSAFKAWLAGFGIVKTFSLGLRGYVGAGIWLAIPTTLIAVGRKGILALIGGVMLVIVIVYLPFLQIHFAVHDRFRRIFQVDAVRYLFARAPLAFFFAFVSTCMLALPLYLLKIELVPRDALWLPAAVFMVTIFPCKLLAAWAYHRGAVREERRHFLLVWFGRLGMIPVAIFYSFIVFLTQYTGWHGVLGLYEHHAFLLPVPF